MFYSGSRRACLRRHQRQLDVGFRCLPGAFPPPFPPCPGANIAERLSLGKQRDGPAVSWRMSEWISRGFSGARDEGSKKFTPFVARCSGGPALAEAHASIRCSTPARSVQWPVAVPRGRGSVAGAAARSPLPSPACPARCRSSLCWCRSAPAGEVGGVGFSVRVV